MLERMREQGGNHQTTIIHIDPIDLNVMGIFHRTPTNEPLGEDSIVLPEGEVFAGGLTYEQLLQRIMENDPKYRLARSHIPT